MIGLSKQYFRVLFPRYLNLDFYFLLERKNSNIFYKKYLKKGLCRISEMDSDGFEVIINNNKLL